MSRLISIKDIKFNIFDTIEGEIRRQTEMSNAIQLRQENTDVGRIYTDTGTKQRLILSRLQAFEVEIDVSDKDTKQSVCIFSFLSFFFFPLQLSIERLTVFKTF